MAARVERTVRAQREFVANASHQLRTPLTGIKLRLEARIAETSDDEEVRTQLRAADKEVDRLSQIIERLLTMASQIEEGTVPHADLGDAVERAVHRWQERAVRASSTLSNADRRRRRSRSVADPDDVDQVLDVLIDNALTHAAGPIRVIASAGPGRAVGLRRGPRTGIPADEVARVTERFFRGRGAATGGSGLGLGDRPGARRTLGRWPRPACRGRRHPRGRLVPRVLRRDGLAGLSRALTTRPLRWRHEDGRSPWSCSGIGGLAAAIALTVGALALAGDDVGTWCSRPSSVSSSSPRQLVPVGRRRWPLRRHARPPSVDDHGGDGSDDPAGSDDSGGNSGLGLGRLGLGLRQLRLRLGRLRFARTTTEAYRRLYLPLGGP